MVNLDKTDWRIITLLNQDGRMSNTEIAHLLGNVSARTVKNRIEVLTENSIINVRAIVNPDKVGYEVLADVFIATEPGKLRLVANKLADLPQISYLACATGDTDIIISVRAPNIEELYSFVTEVIGKVDGVRHTETYLLPLSIKSNETWIPSEAHSESRED